jgi:hypothetical protein
MLYPAQLQFGICEHYAGYLEFLNVLSIFSNTDVAVSRQLSLDGEFATVASEANTDIRTYRNS